jgi:hypothetical protein
VIAAILEYFASSAFKGLLGTVWKGFCDFISTPIGAALIAGLIMCGVGDAHGYRVTNAAWQTKWSDAEAAAEKARIKRDADIKAKVEADANQRLAAVAARKTQLEQMVQAYEDDEARQAAVGNYDKARRCSCVTDGSDARWLRDAERGRLEPEAHRGFALRLRTIGR